MATISRSGISTAQAIQATHITNIIDALDGTSTTVTVVATGSFSGSLTGNLVGTATNATNAASVAFTGITSLPASLAGFNNDGVSSVSKIIASAGIGSVTNGSFNYVEASATVTITLATRAYVGFEATFFYSVDGGPGYDVQFAAGGQTVISANSYLKMNGVGSAVVAKYIAADTWALIGNLKA